jgi:predicted nuclease of restriction endonuclease-like (RecB) superfamily
MTQTFFRFILSQATIGLAPENLGNLYAHKAIEHGWSRAVLTHHIETQLHKREGKAVTNFQRTLWCDPVKTGQVFM